MPPLVVEALDVALPMLDRRWRGQFLRERDAGRSRVRAAARRCASCATIRRWRVRRLRGFYPIGEGAGYAGGIVSAALDGLRAAKAIIRRYAPLDA